MDPEPFPGRGPDGQEPGSSRLLPGDGNATGEDRDGGPDWGGAPPGEPEQGLYVWLPAGQLTLAGFAGGGAADAMAPGPLLAAVLHAVTGQPRRPGIDPSTRAAQRIGPGCRPDHAGDGRAVSLTCCVNRAA
jgi:hypothetical protein